MERPNDEFMTNLLKEYPLPWTIIPEPSHPGKSWVIDSNGRSLIGIRTSLRNHQPVLDLLRYLLLDRMPELDA